MNKYKEWCIRQGSRAQCSPGLIVLGMVAVVAAVCYVYRGLIVQTLIDLAIVIGCLAGAIAIVMVLAHGITYRRHMQAERPMAPSLYEEDEVTVSPERPKVNWFEASPTATGTDPKDRPVPTVLDAELDADLLNLTGK